MKKIKVILTACGCPGASTFIQKLKNNKEREIEIVGVDADSQATGRFLVDEFYKVPLADSKEYIPAMLDLAEKEKADVLFPESSYEMYPLAINKRKFEKLGTEVIVSDPEPIAIANNKYKMYEILRKETDIKLPKYYYPKNLDDFVNLVYELGYPKRPVCFKPHIGKGSRGFRFIDAVVDREELLMKYKPNSRYMSLEEFIEIFKNKKNFPDLLLMERVRGMEYTTDPIALNGKMLMCTTKTVEEARWGIIVRGELVDRPKLVEQTKKILGSIKLSYNVNLQFIEDKLIEINPRVSTFIYQDDLIAPYLSIKLALGELIPAQVAKYQDKIDYGRKMVRYMDQAFWKPKKK